MLYKTLVAIATLSFALSSDPVYSDPATANEWHEKPEASSKDKPSREGFQPKAIRYGATVKETQSALQGLCKTANVRQIKPSFTVMRDLVKDKQLQLDCDGFPYFGKPRWAEFVFADDSLELVWIMTDKSDEPLLLKAMKAEAGEPTHTNDKFIASAKKRYAIRSDRSEVLFYSERIAAVAVKWFETPSTFR